MLAEALILDNLGRVRSVANDVCRRLPSFVDRDELESAGMEALVACAHRYDPASRVPFGRYASRRIEGAMFDELRASDRRPGPRYRKGEAFTSLDAHPVEPAEPDPSPEQVALDRDVLDHLRAAVGELPEHLRLVLHAAFFDGRRHRDSIAELGVTEMTFYIRRREALELLHERLIVTYPDALAAA
jgi:RNA polymerase sigma factor for flagellar operon FliA